MSTPHLSPLDVADLERIRHGNDLYHEVVDFLHDEAALLDDRRHDEWLAILTDDIRYHVPVRVTTAHTLATSTSSMAHFDEDLYSLRKRVERFATEHAWAEDPPSRTRRFLTNIRCWHAPDDEILVEASLLLFRSRGDIHEHDLVSGRRHDLLRREGTDLRLASRRVWLDEAVLRTQNLAVFL